MTEGDDKLSRRYRDGSREEPPAHLDAAILAASRRAVGAGPRARKPTWMVPASIAAVLVLGIGVSLRMQMEKPGIESSVPGGSAEYPVPAAEPPATAVREAAPAQPATVPAPTEEKRDAPRALAKRADPAPAPAPPPAPAPAPKITVPTVTPPPPAPAAAEAPAARDRLAQSPMAEAQAPAGAAAAPQAPPREAEVARLQRAEPRAFPDANVAPAQRAAAAPRMDSAKAKREIPSTPDPDPARELERIAALREAMRHGEADAALAQFRTRHPDYRIPDAVWERVKPRNP